MEPLAVVKLHVPPPAVHRFRHAAVILAIDLLILHAAPSPFYKDVLEDSPTSIPADAKPTRQQRLGQRQARALGPLIGGEDCRRRPAQSPLQGGYAKMAVQGHPHLPRPPRAALPVPAGPEGHKALGPSHGGGIPRPDEVGTPNRPPRQ